ncbi:hypothetical protein [Photobacterium leiognathi]|uniref:hypothetical protein n=1 Tax=Photobacterium leiognathi TaxID=553611 RepID=UPI0029814819|nr:hypothetical protein [Photobacterium leiognathi]
MFLNQNDFGADGFESLTAMDRDNDTIRLGSEVTSTLTGINGLVVGIGMCVTGCSTIDLAMNGEVKYSLLSKSFKLTGDPKVEEIASVNAETYKSFEIPIGSIVVDRFSLKEEEMVLLGRHVTAEGDCWVLCSKLYSTEKDKLVKTVGTISKMFSEKNLKIVSDNAEAVSKINNNLKLRQTDELMPFEYGQKVKCVLTGYVGRVVSEMTSGNGVWQYELITAVSDGTSSNVSVDRERLESVLTDEKEIKEDLEKISLDHTDSSGPCFVPSHGYVA